MRLIDADKIDFEEVFKGASDFAKDIKEAAQGLIERQQTAYDVEAVCEEIQNPNNYTIMAGKRFTTIERTVEIVRNGGNK